MCIVLIFDWFNQNNRVEWATIYTGTLNRKAPEPNSIVFNVTKENFIIHSGYDPERCFQNDIALVRLPTSLKFSGKLVYQKNHDFFKFPFSDRIKPIKLINSNDANSFDDKVVVVSGWGDTTDFGNFAISR